MKKLILIFLFIPTFCFSETITFQWGANTEPDLAGYKLYQSNVSGGSYTQLGENIPKENTEITINESDARMYYVLTAYDAEGLESDYSNEVSHNAKPNAPNINIVITINVENGTD